MDSICFISFEAYPLIKNIPGNVGGAELQQVLLARELADRGYNVYFVVFDYGQPNIEVINKIYIYKTFSKKELFGLGKLRAVKKLWSVLSTINADVYYHRAAVSASPLILGFCKMFNKKYTLAIASDLSITGEHRKELGLIADLFNISLRKADIILAQTEYQASIIREKFKREVFIVPNIFPIKYQCEGCYKYSYILWVGKINSIKDPLTVLEIAKKLPQIPFVLIGPHENDAYYQLFHNELIKYTNVKYIGPVVNSSIHKYYHDAAIIINTSDAEGFPNVFLEAWSHGKPVISLKVNPDDIFNEYDIGICSGSVNNMISDIEKLYNNGARIVKIGAKAQKYVNMHHNSRLITNQLEEILIKHSR
jgi:glycosyltransferase involved in cell wall biosynthesis